MSNQLVHACCEDAQFSLDYDENGWFLDEDYRKGAYIKFCPFCGERLQPLSTGDRQYSSDNPAKPTE